MRCFPVLAAALLAVASPTSYAQEQKPALPTAILGEPTLTAKDRLGIPALHVSTKDGAWLVRARFEIEPNADDLAAMEKSVVAMLETLKVDTRAVVISPAFTQGRESLVTVVPAEPRTKTGLVARLPDAPITSIVPRRKEREGYTFQVETRGIASDDLTAFVVPVVKRMVSVYGEEKATKVDVANEDIVAKDSRPMADLTVRFHARPVDRTAPPPPAETTKDERSTDTTPATIPPAALPVTPVAPPTVPSLTPPPAQLPPPPVFPTLPAPTPPKVDVKR